MTTARAPGCPLGWPPWRGLLDGLRFLLSCGSGPVLATIAAGVSWGPRDGSSPFERALDALLARLREQQPAPRPPTPPAPPPQRPDSAAAPEPDGPAPKVHDIDTR